MTWTLKLNIIVSCYHGNALLSLPTGGLIPEDDVWLLYDDYIHPIQLHLPRTCHRDVQTR
jgi:hypothetical protein